MRIAPIFLVFCLSASVYLIQGSDVPSSSAKSPEIELSGLSNDEFQKMMSNSESHAFATEVDRMMKIIINSLYKNKEIFLRELISNASDALDKIRIISLSDSDALKDKPELQVFIKADKDNKQLIIRDTGIGMTKKDMVQNLGTIAKSGTSDFLSKFQSSKAESETSDLIGQFGVGFYSAFLVADKITVVSKHNDDEQYIWESESNSYSITKDPRGNTLKRGTEIVLHLKQEAHEYLNEATLKDITKKYSQFVSFPIFLWESEKIMVDAEPEEEKPTTTTEEEVEEEKETKEKKPKQVEKTVWNWKQINTQKPLWKRAPADVAESEYEMLFKAVTPKSYEKKMAHIHFKAEGDINFNAILFIPEQVYGDMFSSNEDSREKAHIRLYVRNVFITDELQDLIPRYLSFIRAVVDSEDLPLNVSRESLQQNKLMKLIRQKLVRKILEMIQKMDEETFKKFWSKYSINLKVGIYEDKSNTKRISKLLRYHSTVSQDKLISLDDYVKRMKKGQTKIFAMTAMSKEEALQSPFVERALKMGYEVLLMTDPVDEYTLMQLSEYDGKKLQNLAKEGAEFYETEESKTAFEDLKKEYQPLCDWLTKEALEDKISKAQLSNNLIDSPTSLVTPEHGMSGLAEKMMALNSLKAGSNDENPIAAMQRRQKRIFELNPRHPLVKELRVLVSEETDEAKEKAKDLAILLFDTASIRSGLSLHDTTDFAKRVELLMRKNFGISSDLVADADPHFVSAPEKSGEEEEKAKDDDAKPVEPEAGKSPVEGKEEAIIPKDEL